MRREAQVAATFWLAALPCSGAEKLTAMLLVPLGHAAVHRPQAASLSCAYFHVLVHRGALASGAAGAYRGRRTARAAQAWGDRSRPAEGRHILSRGT
jgi:hypothetical protein